MVDEGVRTVLRPERQSLLGYIFLSVFGHGSVVIFAVVVTLVGRACGPSKPVIDLDRTLEVSMVVLPKADTKMPDKAARAPVPKGAPSPEPTPPKTPPVKQSDLAIHTEKPEPKPEGVDADDRRDELMEEMRRQELLENLLNAPEGAVDRNATDPNSTSDLMINALGTGARGDPEFARYIAQVQQIFMQHFRPLSAITQANPDLVTKVFITVDPESGRITRWEISESSGVAAFDAAAERAVTEVTTIPLPPVKYRPLVAQGYVVNFRAP